MLQWLGIILLVKIFGDEFAMFPYCIEKLSVFTETQFDQKFLIDGEWLKLWLEKQQTFSKTRQVLVGKIHQAASWRQVWVSSITSV